MKKTTLLLILLVLPFLGMAQLELLDQDWKLHSMIIDGETIDVPQYHPSNPEYDPSIQFSESDLGYEIFAIIDFNNFFDQGTIINEDNFILQSPGVTLGDCNYCQLELEYLSIILFGNGEDQRTITYEIVQGQDNQKTLILTTPEGNTAIHGNYILSTDEFNETSVTLYPNPAMNELFVTSENIEIDTFNIYDIHGKVVLGKTIFDGNSIHISALDSGLYFLEITSEEGMVITKFIRK